jgi:hypothetical protein
LPDATTSKIALHRRLRSWLIRLPVGLFAGYLLYLTLPSAAARLSAGELAGDALIANAALIPVALLALAWAWSGRLNRVVIVHDAARGRLAWVKRWCGLPISRARLDVSSARGVLIKTFMNTGRVATGSRAPVKQAVVGLESDAGFEPFPSVYIDEATSRREALCVARALGLPVEEALEGLRSTIASVEETASSYAQARQAEPGARQRPLPEPEAGLAFARVEIDPEGRRAALKTAPVAPAWAWLPAAALLILALGLLVLRPGAGPSAYVGLGLVCGAILAVGLRAFASEEELIVSADEVTHTWRVLTLRRRTSIRTWDLDAVVATPGALELWTPRRRVAFRVKGPEDAAWARRLMDVIIGRAGAPQQGGSS